MNTHNVPAPGLRVPFDFEDGFKGGCAWVDNSDLNTGFTQTSAFPYFRATNRKESFERPRTSPGKNPTDRQNPIGPTQPFDFAALSSHPTQAPQRARSTERSAPLQLLHRTELPLRSELLLRTR
jgi:hypothetical protein